MIRRPPAVTDPEGQLLRAPDVNNMAHARQANAIVEATDRKWFQPTHLDFVEPHAYCGEIGDRPRLPGRLDRVVERYVDNYSDDENRQVQDERAADPGQHGSLARSKVKRRRQGGEGQGAEEKDYQPGADDRSFDLLESGDEGAIVGPAQPRA